MNNLEWLWEHERDKLVKLIVGEYDMCDICFYDPNYPDCGGDCERNVREWLLAEHDSNGTCPDGNGTCPNDEPCTSEAEKVQGCTGDSVAIMRDLRGCVDMTMLKNRLCHETGTHDLVSALETLADMVERDYVSRMDYEDAAELCGKYADTIDMLTSRCTKLEAERDELTDKIGEITNEASELMKKQPYTFDVHDAPGSLRTVGRYIDELRAERDEWKSKAEQAERAMNVAAGKWAKADEESRELRKMLALDDGTIEEYTERADPSTALAYQKQLAEEWRDRCHNAEAWCDKLESERDEWKAKYEAKSAKRAAAVERLQGMTLNTGSAIKKLAVALDVKWNPDNSPLSMSILQNALIDLLDDDAHSKAHSSTEPNMSEQSESLSDANDDFTPESVVTAEAVDANDMNAMVTTMPLKMPSEIKVQYVCDESCNQVADQGEHTETPPTSKCDDRADYWKSRAEKAEKEREQWRSKCGKLMGLANEMMSA